MKKLWLLLGAVVILGLVVCAKPNGAIEVKSTPEGAAIYLDDDATGEKTNTILADLEPDDYTVKLVLEGYDDWTKDVTVEGGDTVTVEATLVANAFGALQVNSTPEGAAIELDGTATGETTNAFFDSLAIGSHTLKLTLDLYEDWETTVTIVKDEIDTVEVVLVLKTGSIQVNSEPNGAAIELDGAATDQVTNYLFDEVPLGEYTIKLTLDGYADWDTTVTVNEDETATIDAVLEEAPKEEIELKEDEADQWGYGLLMETGDRLAVKFTPPKYPFELTEACYVPLTWPDWPDSWAAPCNLVFFGEGTQGPGSELKRVDNVKATQQGNWNWFDVSNLDIKVESGSFYFAVENRQDSVPGLMIDQGSPPHHASWVYDAFSDVWTPWEDIPVSILPVNLGDTMDLVLRVKGLVPGGGQVVLKPTVIHETPSSGSRVTLPADRKYEILDWRELR